MATRRPASSRARYNNNTNPMPPPQQQRPKSVMEKQASSSRTSDDLESSAASTPALQKARNLGNGDTNIQVVVRCRGRSEREMQESSPGIVQINGAKNKDLTIETSTPVSSLGMINPPPTRTYPFDLVFAPEATQSMIYHDVVGPMLEEVLLGYNCTLFAYGQTGTGKTYTMQGDLSPTPMGNPSAHAGVIPRVLFRLFHELEKSYTDFVVKVSYVELYNEELRDLLASDFVAPANSTQPMGMAAKDAKAAEGGLKIFDEVKKGGVFIQGLEEVAVKDSKDALGLLTKGSERRQIAATKFNDHSSRSHSIFCVTVHLKEKNNMGDDLLKVGKLNLVDLAGSENIGRSGAENKRAREAGMINQSLLTLGRVINALVDKAQHVPYRESKLTRLLQDSLGGRTKTCIIATISPARSNLEETLSTLDYALRAKSIKNKPELNQRMTRNSLLKEYIVEIDRLKADLLAAREKNGIYFSDETWNQMNAENELRQTELVEAKKQVDIIESQMRNVRDEFDQSIALLKRKEEELQQTRANLQQKEETLQQRQVELQQVTDAYEEEVVVREAHQATEVALNGVAAGLKSVAAQSLRDISGLFEKLDRKTKVLQSNKRVVSENEKLIHSFTNNLLKKLAELSQLSQSMRTNLRQETEQFRSSEQRAVSEHIQQIDTHFATFQELFQKIDSHGSIEDNALITIKQEVQAAATSFKSQVSSWGDSLTKSCDRLCKEATEASVTQLSLLERSVSILHSLVDTISREVQTYLTDERDALTQMHSLSKNLATEEVSHLRRQNELLAKMLVDERKNAEKAKADLLQRVSGLLGDFMQKRDDSLKESIGSLQRSNKEVEDLLTSTYKRQSQAHDDMIARNVKMSLRAQEVGGKGVQAKTKSVEAAAKTKELIEHGMDEMHDTVSNSVASHSLWTGARSKEMSDSCGRALDEHARAKRAKVEATDLIHANLEQLHSLEQASFASSSKRIQTYTGQSLSWIQDQGESAKDYEDFVMDNLESIEQAANNLSSKGVKDDAPSGSTPRKRKWQYTDEWSRTGSRDDLLNDWRRQKQRSTEDDVDMEEPRMAVGKHRPSNSIGSENEAPVEEVAQLGKAEARTEVPPAAIEPLVESKRRNHVSTIPGRVTRRAR